MGHELPPLDHVVDWKQTFFLNLISQLPCNLTVAVCEKITSTSPATSALPVNAAPSQAQRTPTTSAHSMAKKDTLLPASTSSELLSNHQTTIPIPRKLNSVASLSSLNSSSRQNVQNNSPTPTTNADTATQRLGTSAPANLLFASPSSNTPTTLANSAKKHPPLHNPFLESASPKLPSTDAPKLTLPEIPPAQHHQPLQQSEPPQIKTRMSAKKRIVKKVYSAPYKSRMDVKDALMNECSFPLVYYTVSFL
jgi:hypothetical protein